ncbi:hypothetical protein BP00DRAFT_35036 [Aspergillus indologenus CBS 114.80]|uniref:Uncharacterized protein n=1 Tax=Aspergillus indologenus CBS 114.80 TaxID=1450541 RepID=A0A2V5HYC9_9EURO|nr:hypothetical protein BP00DRAFT_35036 [Aspergillus indologenus CBS 114.80]
MLLDTPHLVFQLLRSYPLRAWLDCLQALEDQLDNFDFDGSHEYTMHDHNSRGHAADELIDENGMKGALLHYLLSLETESRRLRRDMCVVQSRPGDHTSSVLSISELMDKYLQVQFHMESILSRTQHRLDMKQNSILNT